MKWNLCFCFQSIVEPCIWSAAGVCCSSRRCDQQDVLGLLLILQRLTICLWSCQHRDRCQRFWPSSAAANCCNNAGLESADADDVASSAVSWSTDRKRRACLLRGYVSLLRFNKKQTFAFDVCMCVCSLVCCLCKVKKKKKKISPLSPEAAMSIRRWRLHFISLGI